MRVRIDIFFIESARIVDAVEFKWRITSTRILEIIIDKFNYWKELSLIILLEIDESSEVGLYYIILPLYLTISL